MCGLVGYVGESNAINIVLNSLKKLEYRGYDSAGIGFIVDDEIIIKKEQGFLEKLEKSLSNQKIVSKVCIGHTRWATHGEASKQNAHPHQSQNKKVAVVHNGIIENYKTLKSDLKNIKFLSDTDTEVFAQMLGEKLKDDFDEMQILQTINDVCKKIKGSYAFAILLKSQPDKVFFAKNQSPLVVGTCNNSNIVASDIPAILPYTKKAIFPKDKTLGFITKDKVNIFDFNLKKQELIAKNLTFSEEQSSLGEYKTFMEKEITQGSQTMENTIKKLEEDKELKKALLTHIKNSKDIHIVGCGTAYHAGLVAKFLIEKECRYPIFVHYASEFRYKNPILYKNSLCIFISQSGETQDTLKSLQLAKSRGAICIALTNSPASQICKMAHLVIPTFAGIEISVASTKAYIGQLCALYYFCFLISLANKRKISFSTKDILSLAKSLQSFSSKDCLKKIVPILAKQKSLFFIGRGIDYYLAMEGSLKLKEVSYIHCSAFAGGELKHGSLSLLSDKSYVIVLLTQKNLSDKMLSNISEIRSRGAKVVLFSDLHLEKEVDYFVPLKKGKQVLMPFVLIKPLQELALLCATQKGLNPDKPRNLAKSVTVE